MKNTGCGEGQGQGSSIEREGLINFPPVKRGGHIREGGLLERGGLYRGFTVSTDLTRIISVQKENSWPV